jgi:dGTPase
VCDVIENSAGNDAIVLSPLVERTLLDLRGFLFERVYRNPVAKGEEGKAQDMLQRLFRFYEENPEKLPVDFQPQISMDGMRRTICDYIAGMTDKFAVDKYTELFIPMGWHVR